MAGTVATAGQGRGLSVGSDHRALRELVCDALRDRIISGVLAPGDRLVEDRLAEELGVSRNPVREALRVLAVEGYVELVPRRGAVVARLSPEAVAEIFEVRSALEALAAQLAARHADGSGVAELLAVIDDAQAAIDAGDTASLPALNTRFHGLVLSLASNSVLADLMEPLRGRVQWIFSRTAVGRAKDSLAEHRRLAEAIASGDEEEAARVAVAHVAEALATYRSTDEAAGRAAEPV